MKRPNLKKPSLQLIMVPLLAQGQSPGTASLTLSVNTLLIVIALLLLLVIGVLSYILLASTDIYRKHKGLKKSGEKVLKSLLLIMASAGALQVWGQEGVPPAGNPFSDANLLRYMLIGVVVLEFLVMFVLIYWIRFFTGIEELQREKAVIKKKQLKGAASWWSRVNKLKPIEEEHTLDVGHSYDGIRELDNPVPAWFSIAFIASILFGLAYLWRYEVTHSGLNQYEEYQAAVTKGDLQVAAYMKTKGDAVNENTVTMLDAAGIEAGKKFFVNNCTACHGNEGQGGVGPNLTDDYWLHGGSIGKVFHTIKFGVVEKGMMSWKDIFSAEQIAQISSYIKSIQGTNPPGAKAPQGELDKDTPEAAASGKDSTALKDDKK
ncbi:cbb3-type cytochrome c oxidase N-terminal domain-containing protein [Niabella hirudinis]|uniref:cbb3-type cytochrome c oxidase N-terminal domain-containing protein n=1 Tax=Niabella hirudinis TaxID=1285929 RepID=UPI003EBA955F